MKRIKELSRCCGAGGGFKSAFNDYAENIGLGRVQEAKETNAEVIITGCPFSPVNLNADAKKGNIPLKTIDLVELTWESLQIPKVKERGNPKDAVCD